MVSQGTIIYRLQILNCAKVAFRKMRQLLAKIERVRHGGAIGFLGSKPYQKFGPPGIPFGSTIILKSCFPKFKDYFLNFYGLVSGFCNVFSVI